MCLGLRSTQLLKFCLFLFLLNYLLCVCMGGCAHECRWGQRAEASGPPGVGLPAVVSSLSRCWKANSEPCQGQRVLKPWAISLAPKLPFLGVKKYPCLRAGHLQEHTALAEDLNFYSQHTYWVTHNCLQLQAQGNWHPRLASSGTSILLCVHLHTPLQIYAHN